MCIGGGMKQFIGWVLALFMSQSIFAGIHFTSELTVNGQFTKFNLRLQDGKTAKLVPLDLPDYEVSITANKDKKTGVKIVYSIRETKKKGQVILQSRIRTDWNKMAQLELDRPGGLRVLAWMKAVEGP